MTNYLKESSENVKISVNAPSVEPHRSAYFSTLRELITRYAQEQASPPERVWAGTGASIGEVTSETRFFANVIPESSLVITPRQFAELVRRAATNAWSEYKTDMHRSSTPKETGPVKDIREPGTNA